MLCAFMYVCVCLCVYVTVTFDSVHSIATKFLIHCLLKFIAHFVSLSSLLQIPEQFYFLIAKSLHLNFISFQSIASSLSSHLISFDLYTLCIHKTSLVFGQIIYYYYYYYCDVILISIQTRACKRFAYGISLLCLIPL